MADNKDEVSEIVSGDPTQKQQEQEQEVEKLAERCVCPIKKKKKF